jgi:hypothetical protein
MADNQNKMSTGVTTIFLLACLVLLACNPKQKQQNIAVSEKKDRELQWKDRFKDLVLCHCVVAGISDSAVRRKIFMTDKSFHDQINVVMKDDFKQILNPVIAEMRKDSITSLSTVGEGAQGKHIFDSCLKFYKSKKLDSLTDEKFVKWKRTNIDSVMAAEAPAY